VELLASFARHEELIAPRSDKPIVSENAASLTAKAQSRIFKVDRELQLLAYSLSQAVREYCREMPGLQAAMENREPTPRVI
jgi:hypothetical protein